MRLIQEAAETAIKERLLKGVFFLFARRAFERLGDVGKDGFDRQGRGPMSKREDDLAPRVCEGPFQRARLVEARGDAAYRRRVVGVFLVAWRARAAAAAEDDFVAREVARARRLPRAAVDRGHGDGIAGAPRAARVRLQDGEDVVVGRGEVARRGRVFPQQHERREARVVVATLGEKEEAVLEVGHRRRVRRRQARRVALVVRHVCKRKCAAAAVRGRADVCELRVEPEEAEFGSAVVHVLPAPA
mmetsp:Transcript_27238/g.94101  ORF Transcript_27238/g.94101 Transcript_27238/m.94101 type:complete len:245 (-) Transcript_27238:364-1098(-)